MQFREVAELIPGTNYKIVSNVSNCVNEGINVSTNYLHRFKHVPKYKILETVNFLPNFHTYYDAIFQRERIQTDMEHRAVNKLLRQITCDPTFTWIGVSPTTPILWVVAPYLEGSGS